MSKLLELKFDSGAPMVEAFIVKPSQIPEIKKEQGLEGYDWIVPLQDFHSHAHESLCGGMDIYGCEVSAKLDGEAFPISGILITSTEKNLSDDEYTEELEWRQDDTPLEQIIKSKLIVSYADLRDSGGSLQPEHGDYVIIAFVETRYSDYTVSLDVEDDFILHDLDLVACDLDLDLGVAGIVHGHSAATYRINGQTRFVEAPLFSIKYKGECFPIEQDFTSYAPLFECYKFENGEFLPAEELSDFFNDM